MRVFKIIHIPTLRYKYEYPWSENETADGFLQECVNLYNHIIYLGNDKFEFCNSMLQPSIPNISEFMAIEEEIERWQDIP